jgi:peptidoglycan/LPS O-acetylase OafA/YrhL
MNPMIAYRPDIDGLRAVAVLLVLLFHAFPSLVTGGFVGVDIFFVISGFLITGILRNELRDGTFSIARFYGRRLRRIVPALLVVLGATLGAGWYLLEPAELHSLSWQVIGSALFSANIFFWMNAGYFDAAAITKPLLHIWSLGVEEQYYLVWPFLLYLAWKRQFSLASAAAVLAVVSMVANIALIEHHRSAAFFLPMSRLWELSIGAMLTLTGFTAKGKAEANLGAVAGLALIGASVVLLDEASFFPGWWALLPTVGAALIMWAGPQSAFNKQVLGSRVFVWLGLISYPLYLWHWPILSFLHTLAGGMPVASIRAGALVAAVVLAWLTYVFIEHPVRVQPTSRVAGWLFAGLVAFALAGLAIFLKGAPAPAPAVVVPAAPVEAAAPPAAPAPEAPPAEAAPKPAEETPPPAAAPAPADPPKATPAAEAKPEVKPETKPAEPTAAVATPAAAPEEPKPQAAAPQEADLTSAVMGSGFEWRAQGCGGTPAEEADIRDCFTDRREPAKFIIWGDSHANALMPGLLRESTPGARWAQLGAGGCPPMAGGIRRTYPGDPGYDTPVICSKANDATIKIIESNANIKAVVFVTASRMVTPPLYSSSPDVPVYENAIVEGMSAAAQRAHKAGKKVYFLIDNPSLPHPKDCISRAISIAAENKKSCSKTLKEHQEASKKYLELVARFKAAAPFVEIVDPTSVLCKNKVCGAAQDGKFLYTDGDHLSDTGNGLVARYLIDHMKAKGN